MTINNGSTVELIDRMGSDARVLEAARVSTGAKVLKGETIDKKLIFYLMEHEHHSPFEQIVFTFKIKSPIFVMRQLLRHRLASPNEASGRYREMKTEFFIPSKLRLQNLQGNKQGSSGELSPELAELLLKKIEEHYQRSSDLYQELLSAGVAKELSRVVLPISLYTEIVWTINFRALMNFLRLRLDGHAQPEIQEIAQEVEKIVKPLIPWSYEAFEKFSKEMK